MSSSPGAPQGVRLYDTTLRDGLGMEGLSLSVEDKVAIARRLDEIGVDYVEGGYPGSNPKDAEFFARMRETPLRNAKLVAFGSTRRAGGDAASDAALLAVLESETPVVTLVGKSSAEQVREVLETTEEENLAMIADSVRLLVEQGREVIFDAEHFFDGYRRTIRATRSPPCARPPGRARAPSRSATPTAARCPARSSRASARRWARSTARSAFTSTTTPTSRSQTRCSPCRRARRRCRPA